MTPAQILLAAGSSGVALTAQGEFLHYRTASGGPLPRELAIEIQRAKPTLLRVLSEPLPLAPCRVCRESLWWQSEWGKWTCGVCHPPRLGPGDHDPVDCRGRPAQLFTR